jgi:hypothetical protein
LRKRKHGDLERATGIKIIMNRGIKEIVGIVNFS